MVSASSALWKHAVVQDGVGAVNWLGPGRNLDAGLVALPVPITVGRRKPVVCCVKGVGFPVAREVKMCLGWRKVLVKPDSS